MRIHVILIFVISFGALLGVTVMRTEQTLLGERNAGLTGLLEGQNSGLVPALDAELKALSHDLAMGFKILDIEKTPEYDLAQPYSRFLMIGKTNPLDSGDWEIPQVIFRANTAVKPWATSYSKLALKSIQQGKVIRGGIQILTLLDPHRTPHLLMLYRTGQNDWFIGILGSETFQGLMDRQKGLGTETYVVNATAQVVAHGTPEYIGSLLSEDPVVKDLMGSGKVRGSVPFSRSRKELQAVYEQIPTTNLFLVVVATLAPGNAFRGAVAMPMLFLGIGIFVVALALLLLFDRPPKVMAVPRPTYPVPMAAPASPVVSPAVRAAPAGEGPSADRMEAFKTSAATLAQEMKTPLLGVLAQLQSLKAANPALAAELAPVESLAREGRGVLQKIFSFAGEELDQKTEELSVADAVLGAIQKSQPLIAKKNVTVEKDLKPTPKIRANPTLLQKAFAQLIANAAEAMEKSAGKKLRIELADNGGTVEIRFKDTGDGIASEDVGRIFDPFYSTRKARGHLGLGLTSAYAICKEFGGTVSVEQTEARKGTTILVRFPPMPAAAADKSSGGSAASPMAGPPAFNPAPKTAAPAPQPAPAATAAPKAPAVAAAPAGVKPNLSKPPAPAAAKEGLIPNEAIEKTMKMIDELEPLGEPFKTGDMAPPPAPELDDLGELKLDEMPAPAPSMNSLRAGAPAEKPPAPAEKPPAPGVPPKPQLNVGLAKKPLDSMKVTVRKPGTK